MQPNDKTGFLAVLNGMSAMKRTALTPEAIELWWRCMADWSLEEFSDAAVVVMRKTSFMPAPNDFEEVRRAERPTPGEAWAKVLEWIRSGAYRDGIQSFDTNSKPMGDKAIDAAVRMVGGYSKIAFAHQSQLPHIERHFLEHYETQAEVQETRDAIEHQQVTRLNAPQPMRRLLGTKS